MEEVNLTLAGGSTSFITHNCNRFNRRSRDRKLEPKPGFQRMHRNLKGKEGKLVTLVSKEGNMDSWDF